MLEFGVVLILIAINGVFSVSELAIVSARKIRLKRLADDGRRGAAAALALAEDPGRFLSTVQHRWEFDSDEGTTPSPLAP